MSIAASRNTELAACRVSRSYRGRVRAWHDCGERWRMPCGQEGRRRPGSKAEHRRGQGRDGCRARYHRPLEGAGGSERSAVQATAARHEAWRDCPLAQPREPAGDDLHRLRRGNRVRQQLCRADPAQGRRRGGGKEWHVALVDEQWHRHRGTDLGGPVSRREQKTSIDTRHGGYSVRGDANHGGPGGTLPPPMR